MGVPTGQMNEMKIGGLSFNWFDLAVMGVIVAGMFRGRARGMSLEVMDVLMWLLIVTAGGLAYEPVGRFLADVTHFSLPFSYVTAYLFVLLLIRLTFGWIKRMVGEKLVGSDVFGSGEYYLGTVAGGVRFTCYLLVAMALLNSIYVSPEELAAQARMQYENFGDISFPTIGSLQQTVFSRSASGKLVKQYLAHELIATAATEKKTAQSNTWGRERESAVNEVLGK